MAGKKLSCYLHKLRGSLAGWLGAQGACTFPFLFSKSLGPGSLDEHFVLFQSPCVAVSLPLSQDWLPPGEDTPIVRGT